MYRFISAFASLAVAIVTMAVPSTSLATGGVYPGAQCPFSGGTIVKFDKRLVSAWGYDASRQVKSISLPAGKYKVSLASSDGYDWRDQVSQPKEYYHIELYDGSLIAKSNRTQDLQDYVNSAVWSGVVNNSLTVSRDATQIVAQHTAYPDTSSPNSLMPTCVQFVRLADPVNGQCGSANGKAVSSAPTSNLCSRGDSFDFRFENGKWRWGCSGSNGGNSVSCSAPKKLNPVNGQCGSANGKTFDSKPTSNLCSSGTPSAVESGTFVQDDPNAEGWIWSCIGSNGGYSSGCSALKTQPVCGNNKVERGEQCDDGNTTNNDGCSAQCKTETAAITIDKNDNDNHDDTQQVAHNGTAVYKIVVTNTGKVSLTNVVVDDTVSPNCKRSAAQTVNMYNGTTFDPGESFTYTCTETGVTASHGSTASVTGKPVNNAANVSDSDSTNVTVKDAPAIKIVKDDNDNHDDTQKVNEGGTATYTITVTNTGVSPLTDVVITDAKSPNCNRSAAQTKAKYPGDTFDPGEKFTYTCTEANVVKSHSTTASVTGKSTIGGQKVSDSDDTNVTVNNAPAISINKNDADNGDDTQTVDEGKAAKFTITVTNTGNAALKDVVITDAVAKGCAMSAAQTKAKYDGDTFDPNEKFSYICTGTAASASYVNTAKVTAKAVNTNASVDASDTTKVNVKGKPPVVVQPPTPSEEPKEEKGKKKCSGSIGNTIWNDKNANGKQDAGEQGIPGVRVWLYKGNKVYKDTTNSKGRYKFKELCSGTYRVVVKSEDISALYQTYDPDGKLDSRTKVRLKGDNDKHTKADFGYRGAVAPATGPGTVISIILAALTTGFILYFYRRKRMRHAV